MGSGLILLGLLANRWAVERCLAPDEEIESSLSIAVITAGQGLLILAGLWLLARRPRLFGRRPVRLAALAGLGLALAAAAWANVLALRLVDPRRELRQAVEQMIESENRLLALKKDLKRLDHAVQDLDLPGGEARDLFADAVDVIDVQGAAPPDVTPGWPAIGVALRQWPVAPAATRHAGDRLALLAPLLAGIDRFRHEKFNIVCGAFAAGGRSLWDGEVSFDGLARTKSGTWWQVSASFSVRWREMAPAAAGASAPWRIVSWTTKRLKTIEGAGLFFDEVLDEAVPDAATRARARHSVHSAQVLQSYLDPDFKPPHEHWSRPAFDDHPGVAVADVDRDGLDDFYVLDRAGRNMLFHNRGDGTFEDIAPRVGLDIDGHCSSAVFADFDNDGHPDVFIGRTLARSLYLHYENGRFVDRSADLVDGPLPYLVSMVSVADANGDGLLDVYLATYGRDKLVEAWGRRGLLGPRTLLAEFVPHDQASRLFALMDRGQGNAILDCPGPPNVLLWNAGGGRFRADRGAAGLETWRNTYAATWADYDGDGRPDLYCANDFAPNNLFHNEGNGTFTDVTAATRTADLGFGMGASFGDYDGDGRLDLYVSNMFSKAGRRMTSQVPGLDPRFAEMARGNSLLRNTGATFTPVSGLEPPAMLVEKGGWSWGGQFLDVDNDGNLDIHTLSGYETAPWQVEGPVDR